MPTSRSIKATILAIAVPIAAQTCYYPNGDIALNDIPCNATAPESTCCESTYACLSNNICMMTSITPSAPGLSTYVRGSCTDNNWKSGSCPLFCINPAYDDTAGGEGIAKCPDTDLDVYTCIDGAPSNCSVFDNVLSFAGSPTVVKNPAASSTSASTSSSATTSSVTSTTTTTPILSSTRATTATAATAAATTSAPVVKATSNTTAVAIGAGVGVPLGLIALATIVYLVLRYRRKKSTAGGDRAEMMSWAHEHQGRVDDKSMQAPAYSEIGPQEMDGQPRIHELSAGS